MFGIIYRIIRRITHRKSISAYHELLKDPRWKERRLQILKRDYFCCTECGKKGKLQVHHLYYQKGGKLPWEYPDDALTTLCPYCHYKWHILHNNVVRPYNS